LNDPARVVNTSNTNSRSIVPIRTALRLLRRGAASAPLYIGRPPAPTLETIERGKTSGKRQMLGVPWQHRQGRWRKAAGLKDDLGFPILPADLTAGQFKSGPAAEDIFRTMTTGLSGTPIRRTATHCRGPIAGRCRITVLSLSAFKDPLTGEPLPIAPADRAALNEPALVAADPSSAYVPGKGGHEQQVCRILRVCRPPNGDHNDTIL